MRSPAAMTAMDRALTTGDRVIFRQTRQQPSRKAAATNMSAASVAGGAGSLRSAVLRLPPCQQCGSNERGIRTIPPARKTNSVAAVERRRHIGGHLLVFDDACRDRPKNQRAKPNVTTVGIDIDMRSKVANVQIIQKSLNEFL
jgi:hypothetical protein